MQNILRIYSIHNTFGVCVQTRIYNYASHNKKFISNDRPKYDTQYPFAFVVKFYSS